MVQSAYKPMNPRAIDPQRQYSELLLLSLHRFVLVDSMHAFIYVKYNKIIEAESGPQMKSHWSGRFELQSILRLSD